MSHLKFIFQILLQDRDRGRGVLRGGDGGQQSCPTLGEQGSRPVQDHGLAGDTGQQLGPPLGNKVLVQCMIMG